MSAIHQAQAHPDLEIVACAEDHVATREAVSSQLEITHPDPFTMIREAECDIILVGDYYGRRGALAIEALGHGRHVMSDKPIATSLTELQQIAALSKDGGLVVGCQLSLVHNPNFICLRKLIRDGELGEIHQIAVCGQHPLMYGTRPGWYFEPGKHGGTINDIGIHAIHLIPWLTGLEMGQIVAARTWNAFATDCPEFEDAGQFMLTLNNRAGVIADVSYALPDASGYKMPQYWRFTVCGTEGMAETSCNASGVMVWRKENPDFEQIVPNSEEKTDYWSDFLREMIAESIPQQLSITTDCVLRASRQTLEIQAYADESREYSALSGGACAESD